MKEHVMSHLNLSDTTRHLAVRAAVTRQGAAERLLDGARRRAAALADDERGSQTAEYAMVGGVGAAAAGALIACIKNTDVLGRIVEAVLRSMFSGIKGWF
jgi:hypothetical protein